MSLEQFQQHVTSIDELTALVGEPGELVIRKQLSELDKHSQSFIAQSPFVLIGTYSREGQCDVSPRGDSPPVAKVLNNKTLVIPERVGNRRADSMRNIVETGRIALLFMIPGLGETLRVNGRACVIRDDEILEGLTAQGKKPVLAIGIEVEECYLQCAKALIRSKLWTSQADSSEASLPSFAEILIEQTSIEGETVDSLDEKIQTAYETRLY